MRQVVELLYVISMFSPSEQIGYANGRSFNPCPAHFDSVRGVVFSDRILCGDNPWLEVRKVDGLRAGSTPDEAGVEWSERSHDHTEVLKALGKLPPKPT